MQSNIYYADALLDERYFDGSGNVTTLEEVEEDNSFVIEINDRQGGEGMRQFWSKVYEGTYDAAVLFSNLGDSSMIDEMNAGERKNAAIMHTIWPNYRGPVLKPAYPGHIYNMNGVFYVNSFNQLAVQDNDTMAITRNERTMEEIEDWRTKGGRLVVGVSHKEMGTARQVLNVALRTMGMLGLSEQGIVYVDVKTGKLTEERVEPDSPLGEKILREQYGCVYEHGVWSRPEK